MKTKAEIQEVTKIRRRQLLEEFFDKLDWAIGAAAYNGKQMTELELPECLESFCPQIITRYVELGFAAQWLRKIGELAVQVSWEE